MLILYPDVSQKVFQTANHVGKCGCRLEIGIEFASRVVSCEIDVGYDLNLAEQRGAGLFHAQSDFGLGRVAAVGEINLYVNVLVDVLL